MTDAAPYDDLTELRLRLFLLETELQVLTEQFARFQAERPLTAAERNRLRKWQRKEKKAVSNVVQFKG